MTHILFGNVLGISNEDIIQTVVISVITLVTIAILHKDLLLFCFDSTHGRSIGLNTGVLHYILLSLTAVAGLQTVGIILVVAMLIYRVFNLHNQGAHVAHPTRDSFF